LSGDGWRAGVKLQSVKVPASIRTPFLAAAIGLLAAFALLGFMTALSGLLLTERLHDQSLLISGLATFTLFASAAAAQLRAVGSSPARALLFGLAALPAGAGLLLVHVENRVAGLASREPRVEVQIASRGGGRPRTRARRRQHCGRAPAKYARAQQRPP
jgi:hypothetical protein